MNLKKVTQKLAEIRDHVDENGKLSEKDKKELKMLVTETISVAQNKAQKRQITSKSMSTESIIAHNDNEELSADQTFRLRLVEKTGTGSHLIH